MPTEAIQNPQFDSLGRSPEALPFWSRYSLPQRVVFPAANTKRDVAHGLGAIPSGYLVLWSDAPISATPGVNWTPEIAYLQSPVANARAIVIFVQLRESVALGAGGELLGPPPVIAPPTSTPWRVINNADTGTVNNWAPGLAGNTLIMWRGTSNLTLTGIAGGVLGQLVTIKHDAATPNVVIDCNHLQSLSAASNQFVNVATSAPTYLAKGGSITYAHDGVNWKLIQHEQGAGITAPFSASNFRHVSSGAWAVEAGDIATLKFFLAGRFLTVQMAIKTTSVNAGTDALQLFAPAYGGYLSSGDCATRVGFLYEGTIVPGYFLMAFGYNAIQIYKDAGTFVSTTNQTHVQGVMTFEVS